MNTMHLLFHPKSIAMVGATATPSKIGFRIVRNILDHSYKGELFLVNPRGGEMLGRRVYQRIANLPQGIDLVFLAIPHNTIYSAVQECIKKCAKYVVILTAGFRETGEEGRKLELDLAELIKRSSTRLVGPNCAGVCNTHAAFHGSMEIYPSKGDISFISQSGSLCTAFTSNMASRECGISKYISIGNKIDINAVDIVEYLGEDPNTSCIALYIEDIQNGRSLLKTTLNVSRKKPVVVLKSGRTKEGAKATLSHTGAMAGADLLADGALRQMGMIRVEELTQLYDVTASLSKIGALQGKNIAILSDAGGPGVLATDAAISQQLKVPPLSSWAQKELRSHLLAFASVRNPVDMTFTRDVELYSRCVDILAREKMDAILITIPSHFSVKEDICSVLRDVRRKKSIRMAVAWLSADEVEKMRRELWKAGIPAFVSPERAAYCLSRLSWYGHWLRNQEPPQCIVNMIM